MRSNADLQWETLIRNVEFRTKNMTCLATFLLKGPRKEREDVIKVEKKMNVWMARNAVKWRLSLL